ncbi:hypothetical protein CVT24_003925 [Panaeolus cyanescens]|uniref:SCP domain-containing protein n=1 Tax=Panaeolus cyanescens TaxID=181874 RepID=A0A409YXF1_9AGAR|nr:hypothetical protein CVT24_003925 [Panaeolus cyanescens]
MKLVVLAAFLSVFANMAMAAPADGDSTTAAAAPAGTQAAGASDDVGVPIWIGVHPIGDAHRLDPPPAINNTNNQELSKRTTSCYSTEYNILRQDMTALSSGLQNINPWTFLNVPATSYTGWYLGTALLCVYNHQWYGTQRVSRWEGGWSIAHIQNTCGYTGTGLCQGGHTFCSSENGTPLQSILKKYPQEGC